MISMDEYQDLAMRTDRRDVTKEMRLINAGLGIAGEAGEVADIIKKHICQGHVLDEVKLVKEVGDVLWYCALAMSGIGKNLSDAAFDNIGKLRLRYPDGFSVEASVARKDVTFTKED